MHPEIATLRGAARKKTALRTQRPQPRGKPTLRGWVRALKFAFAALLAGSRAIPLGDNGCVTRELGIYGTRMRR